MTFALKSPVMYDFYYGEFPINFDAMVGNAKPVLMGYKATDWDRWFGGSLVRYWKDPNAKEFIREAKEIGVKTLLFHFLRENDINQQALHYIDTINELGGLNGLEPVLDVEIAPANIGSTWAGQIKAWLDRVEDGLKVRPIIYTSAAKWRYTFTRKMVNGAYTLVPPSWTNDYFCWTAGYPYSAYVDANGFVPKVYIPEGWTKDRIIIWQYSEKGRTNGYLANDLDVLSPYYYQRILGVSGTPLPEFPPTGEGMITGKNTNTVDGVKIRTVPIDGLRIGVIAYNSVFTAAGLVQASDGTQWLHIQTVDGARIDGYSAAWLLNYSFDTTPPPVPTPTGDVHVEVDVASGGTVVVSVNGDIYKKI